MGDKESNGSADHDNIKLQQSIVMAEDSDHGGEFDSLHEQLEVVFDSNKTSRRRASLMPDDKGHRPKSGRSNTSCFVHDLISYREQKDDGLAANLQGQRQHSPTDNKQHDSELEHHTHSRLLTKKQLADMALNIRELSKKLGHIRLLLKVRNVFILTKAHDKKLIRYTRDVAEWLMQQQNADGQYYNVWVEETMKETKCFDLQGLHDKDEVYKERLKFWNDELCRKKPHTFEIVVALGGDGTVLYSSWLFQKVVPPVMSFALGSLGFLTKFDFEEHREILTKAFKDGVTVSLRLRFEGTIMRSQKRNDVEHDERDLIDELIGDDRDKEDTHKPDGTHNILNDIVMDRGPNATMSTIEVFGDEEHFTTVQADGIAVATPTGSTAYNLAAGGSLCHPENPVILLTAIAPHTLSFRPIILPDTMVLRLGVPYDARASCWASFDGKERCELNPGDYVTISASRFPFPAVLPLNRKSEDWVDSISRTLNWNNRQRQKAFDDKKKQQNK